MSRLFTTTAFLGAIMAAMAASQEISLSFVDEIPADVSVVTSPGQSLNASYYKIDKNNLVPGWHYRKITDEDAKEIYGVGAVVSCSRIGNNDDFENRLILPELEVKEGALLEWTAKSINHMALDSYDVMVAEGDSDEFSTIAHIEKEGYFYTRHVLPLTDYVGKRIRIAFVHSDKEGYMLALGEVKAGSAHLGFNAVNAGSHYFGRNEEPVLVFDVTNAGGKENTTLKGFEVVADAAEGDTPVVLGSVNFNEVGASGDIFTVEIPVSVNVGDYYDYTLRALYEDESADDIYKDFVNVSEFKRLSVLEKYTATWCTSCPKVYFPTEYYRHRLGDDLVFLEIHVPNTTNADANALSYPSKISTALGGDYPAVWFNRDFAQNTTNVRDRGILTKGIQKECTAEVKLDIDSYDYENIKAKVSFQSANDIDNTDGYYRVAYYIVEKTANIGDSPYTQTNNASGISTLVWGEANYLPGQIPAEMIKYENVVRGPEADWTGIGVDGSLPAEINAGEVYTYEIAAPVPSKVVDPKNLFMVATVQRFEGNSSKFNKSILNADMQDLVLKEESDVCDVNYYGSGISYNLSGNLVTINLPEDLPYKVTFYSAQGQLLSGVAGKGSSVQIPTSSLGSGVVIAHVEQGGNNGLLKLMLK